MSQFRFLLLLSLWLITVGTGWAQEKPAAVAEFNDFRAKPLDGWEWDDDERLGDLIAQLREKESSLEALDARIAKAMGRKSGAKMDESMAWRNNSRMDLNGGGPIRWDAFYGRNAEKFFYHPVDPNTTYHTNTLLRQTEPTAAGGVPGNQGVPAHQRPPQFDYIYRGWEKEQQRAKEKAEELKGKIDEMVSRRRDLEQDVVVLWCKLAFRIFDKEKLSEKPVLRWAAIPKSPDAAADVERAAVLTTATQLLATALLFNESFIEQDAPKAFSTVDAVIKKNRRQFEDGLLEAEILLDESEDMGTALGKYKRLSRKLEDVSKSLTEGYKGWREGDSTDDEPAKYASLRRIQDSVVTYSQILLSLNELVSVMKKEWGTKINTKSTEFTPVWDVAYRPAPTPERSRSATASELTPAPKPVVAAPKNGKYRCVFSTGTGWGLLLELQDNILWVHGDINPNKPTGVFVWPKPRPVPCRVVGGKVLADDGDSASGKWRCAITWDTKTGEASYHYDDFKGTKKQTQCKITAGSW